MVAVCIAAALCGRCTPDNGGKLQPKITDLTIIVTATQTPNVYHLAANRKDIIGTWNLGEGTVVTGANEVDAKYPFAGTYNVTLSAYSNGGRTNDAAVTIPVLGDNFDLLSDSIYVYLAGEVGSDVGKTWVMDSLLYGNVTNLNLSNLAGTPNNTAVPVNAATMPGLRSGEFRLGRTLYDDKATFMLSRTYGQAFKYTNNGSSLVTNTGSNVFKDQVFMKTTSWSPTTAIACNTLPLPAGFTGGYNSDWQVACTPPANMTWSVTNDGVNYWISFPNVADGPGGFLFFALDWASPYQILSLTENRMVVQKQTMSGTGFATQSIRRLVMIKEGTPSGLPLDAIPEAGSYIKAQ